MSEAGSVIGDENSMMEDDNASSVNPNISLKHELEAAGGQSDGESECSSVSNSNALSVDLLHSNQLVSSDVEMNVARDDTSDTGDDIVNSTIAESGQDLEANIHEIIIRECELLKKELKSRDEAIATLKAENAALAITANLGKPAIDASTNTETPATQIRHPDYPGEDGNEQQSISIKKPSPPMSSLAAQTSTTARFLGACFGTVNGLYLVYTRVVSLMSLLGQNFFPSCGRRPVSFKEWMVLFQELGQAIIFLGTPFWIAMSVSAYLAIEHEKNRWMEANALTRKQLLGHVSGQSGGLIWDMLVAMGRMAMMYNRHF
ncbi:hypothetical protein V8C35DRAFT_311320 [Trichoderma chlorosporum]